MDADRHVVATEDAVRWLRSLPAASVDAIITDPPYSSGGFNVCGGRVVVHAAILPHIAPAVTDPTAALSTAARFGLPPLAMRSRATFRRGGMKRADHDRDAATADQVRELVRALGAHVSLELEDRFALLEARLGQLEQLIRERRTVIVRRPIKPGDSRKAVASAGNASPAPSHTPAAAGSLSATEGVAHPTPRRKAP